MLREKLFKESVLDAVAKFIHETRRNTVAWTFRYAENKP